MKIAIQRKIFKFQKLKWEKRFEIQIVIFEFQRLNFAFQTFCFFQQSWKIKE